MKWQWVWAIGIAIFVFTFYEWAMVPDAPMVEKSKKKSKKAKVQQRFSREEKKHLELFTTWRDQPFHREPQEADFAIHMQNKLMKVLGWAPAADQLGFNVYCKSIRCEVEIMGDRSVVDAWVAAFENLRFEEQAAWLELRVSQRVMLENRAQKSVLMVAPSLEWEKPSYKVLRQLWHQD